MIWQLFRAFQPLDTSEADAALAEARKSMHDVAVRARALRMDIGCNAPAAAIERLVVSVAGSAGHLLRSAFGPPPTALPADMQDLLDKL